MANALRSLCSNDCQLMWNGIYDIKNSMCGQSINVLGDTRRNFKHF
jgi:hypothetical protein